MELINYKIDTASEKEILVHLQKCDHRFIPPLSQRVQLESYVEKLKKLATTFEAWYLQELVGLVSVYLNEKNNEIGFISNVSVLEDFEKKGIAGKLVNMTKEYALKNNFSELSLEVNSKNIRVVRFYEYHGFVLSESNDASIYMNCKIK